MFLFLVSLDTKDCLLSLVQLVLAHTFLQLVSPSIGGKRTVCHHKISGKITGQAQKSSQMSVKSFPNQGPLQTLEIIW